MVDDTALAKVYRVLNNEDMRQILNNIGIKGAMSYSEIMEDNRNPSNAYNGSSKTGYYVRHLKNANMIILDNHTKKYMAARRLLAGCSLFPYISPRFFREQPYA